MFPSIDDIEARYRENIRSGVSGNVGVVLPKWNTLGSGPGFTGGKRNYVWIRRKNENTASNE
jgi:hypothetical protein